jgi:hypothetical protein
MCVRAEPARARPLAIGSALAAATAPATAHHGVAGLGAASLEGPGAPLEQSSSATLPKVKSTGFGEPTFTLGATASKMLGERWTVNFDISNLWFQKNTYDADPAHGDQKFTGQFGDEFRVNTAAIYKAYTNPERRVRLDLLGELNYLHLGRDKENGVGERGTGGDILYVTPGVRAYWRNMSFALGVKLPVIQNLNEENEQQGAEGKENYRLIFSVSALF